VISKDIKSRGNFVSNPKASLKGKKSLKKIEKSKKRTKNKCDTTQVCRHLPQGVCKIVLKNNIVFARTRKAR